MNRPDWRGLYLVTPDWADGARLISAVADAVQAGCRIVQYRDKISAPAERLRRAHALRGLLREVGGCFLINDDLPLAHLVDADGVHLGRTDGSLALARAVLGPDKYLGASCYADLARAEAAAQAGVDYLAFGAAYPSATKPDAQILTVDCLKTAQTRFSLPLCVIGGITVDNAPPVLAAGADMLAVVSDVFTAPDIAARVRAYHALFHSSGSLS